MSLRLYATRCGQKVQPLQHKHMPPAEYLVDLMFKTLPPKKVVSRSDASLIVNAPFLWGLKIFSLGKKGHDVRGEFSSCRDAAWKLTLSL